MSKGKSQPLPPVRGPAPVKSESPVARPTAPQLRTSSQLPSEPAPPRAARPVRYEYKRFFLTATNFDARAAELSAEGWELLPGPVAEQQHDAATGGYARGYATFWKRPLSAAEEKTP